MPIRFQPLFALSGRKAPLFMLLFVIILFFWPGFALKKKTGTRLEAATKGPLDLKLTEWPPI
jgi:hypothetical protein